jgi:small-conductance mechanosensitive channel
MMTIDWAHLAHVARVIAWVIVALLAYLAFALLVARLLSDAWRRREREEQLARIRAALVEAEERVAAARANESAVVRRAEALGFFDGQTSRIAS